MGVQMRIIIKAIMLLLFLVGCGGSNQSSTTVEEITPIHEPHYIAFSKKTATDLKTGIAFYYAKGDGSHQFYFYLDDVKQSTNYFKEYGFHAKLGQKVTCEYSDSEKDFYTCE